MRSSKAQTMELLELLILVVGIVIILSISYFIFTARSPNLFWSTVEQHKYERITDVANEFYYSKISGTEKTLAQLLGDRIAGRNPVTYGIGFGNIDVDNLAIQLFNSYFDKNWKFEARGLILGHEIPKDISRVQTFEMPIPVPSIKNEVWNGYLYVW
jgi:hypothetical protein